MRNRYYIQDSAGNDKTSYYGEFASMDEAIEALLEEFDYDESMLDDFAIYKR